MAEDVTYRDELSTRRTVDYPTLRLPWFSYAFYVLDEVSRVGHGSRKGGITLLGGSRAALCLPMQPDPSHQRHLEVPLSNRIHACSHKLAKKLTP
jgi:hypothetical protein